MKMLFAVMLYLASGLYAAQVEEVSAIDYHGFKIKRTDDVVLLRYGHNKEEKEVVIKTGFINKVAATFPVIVLNEWPRTFHPVFYFNPLIDREEKYGPWIKGSAKYSPPLEDSNSCLLKVGSGEPLIFNEDLTVTFENTTYALREESSLQEGKEVIIRFSDGPSKEGKFKPYKAGNDPRVEKTIGDFTAGVMEGDAKPFRLHSETILIDDKGEKVFFSTAFFSTAVKEGETTKLIHMFHIAVSLPLLAPEIP